jgi:hypothetical protein
MRIFVPIFIILTIVVASCKKESFEDFNENGLEFSTDSVIFDTIFSGIGSATKFFKVYNRSSEKIEISEIRLAKDMESKYQINIDGKPSTFKTNVRLNGNDSLYIFVKVTINTNQDALLEQDSIVFRIGENTQDIKLLAWGKDVHLINNETLQTTTWTKDKPYLVYNSMLVDKDQLLRINPGTKIYFHKGSRMYIAGTLEIDGTFEEPVHLQADRLEEMYSDVPGQWDGIWLMNGSLHNKINYANIKNAVIGIQVDTLVDINVPTLSITNSKIEHMSFAGIYAQGSTIFASNCLIADCGFYDVALTIGGSYDFYHCTFANFWQNSFRETPSLLLNNYYSYKTQVIIRDITHAGFYNCLVWGDRDNEISIDNYAGQGILSYEFDHCLLKYNSESNLNSKYLNACLINQDPIFIDYEKYNYQLNALSPAINKASVTRINDFPLFLNFDILQQSRVFDIGPDIGVFEFVK